jgi:hypothetical protein
VVARRLREEAHAIVHRAPLRILRAVIEPADAGEGNGGRTERAGLQRHVEIGAGKAFLAELAGSPANDGDLGMGGDVGLRACPVAGLRDDRAVEHQHGPDRHFAPCAGRARLAKRDLHEAICHRTTNSS